MSEQTEVKAVYLSKDGNIVGPFEPAKIAEMKASGEFYQHDYFWDKSMTEWAEVPSEPSVKPVVLEEKKEPSIPHLPPPPPALPPARAPTPVERSQVNTTLPAKAGQKHRENYRAVCHDNKRTLGGVITKIKERGCLLVCEEGEAPPPFTEGAKVFLDLFDEVQARSLTVNVTLGRPVFDGKGWQIPVLWAKLPGF
ncbi:MAG: DUF4339 domain-containing protein [Methylotenera sp.]|nr:DUF4339 domain-containing protein [Oligoflexia bacterium]